MNRIWQKHCAFKTLHTSPKRQRGDVAIDLNTSPKRKRGDNAIDLFPRLRFGLLAGFCLRNTPGTPTSIVNSPRLRFGLVSLLLVAVVCAPETAWSQAKKTQIPQNVAIEQNLDAQLPLDTELVDESGKTVKLGDYFRGKPVILNFVYFRCPMLCTQVLNGVLKSSQAIQLQMGDDYEVVSISIDPRETPDMAADKKKTYVSRYRRPGAEEGWHFLTADAAAIERLTKVAGFKYHYDKKSDQYAHASGIMIVTPEGRLSRYLYGIDYHPTDLRLALVESSNNQIGSPVDQLLLLCYHYDPATGKYGFVISGGIRIFGSLFAIVLGVYLFRMYRLERRRTAAVLQEQRAKESPAETLV